MILNVKNISLTEEDTLNNLVNVNEDFIFSNLNMINKSFAELKKAKDRLEVLCDLVDKDIFIDDFEVYSLKRLIKKEHLRIWELSILTRKYCSIVRYSDEELSNISLSTKKYACVKTSFKDKVASDVVLPDFKIFLVNLGFEGIDKADTLKLSFKTQAGEIKAQAQVPVGKDILGIGKSNSVTITGFRTPSSVGLYNAQIELYSGDICYMTYTTPVITVGVSTTSSAIGSAIIGTSVIGGAV